MPSHIKWAMCRAFYPWPATWFSSPRICRRVLPGNCPCHLNSLEVSMMVWKWAAYKSTWWRQQIRWLRQKLLVTKSATFWWLWGLAFDSFDCCKVASFKVSFSGVESSQCSYCAELLNSRPHRITRVPTSTCLGYQLLEDEKRMEKNAGIQSILSKHMILSSYHISSYHIVSSIIHQPQPYKKRASLSRKDLVQCQGGKGVWLLIVLVVFVPDIGKILQEAWPFLFSSSSLHQGNSYYN